MPWQGYKSKELSKQLGLRDSVRVTDTTKTSLKDYS